MILTPDYRRVSVFNSPVDYKSVGDRYYFVVDKIVYEVLFDTYTSYSKPGPEEAKKYVVDFRIYDYQGTKQERLDFLNKVTRDNLRSFHFYDDGSPLVSKLSSFAYQISRTGNPLSIFSSVIRIIEEFATKRRVDCFYFDAYEASRQKLYATILKQMAKKGYHIGNSKSNKKTKFEICRKEEQLTL